MKSSDINKLIDLAEIGKTRDIALFAKINRECSDLKAQCETIQMRNRQDSLQGTTDFNAIARWQRWNESEITRLHDRIGALTDEKGVARKIAAKSAAKVQALEILLKKSVKTDLQTNRRRAEQNGQPPDA